MITNGFTFVAFLVLLAGIIVIVEKKSNSKIFNYIPGVVMLYFFAMLLATFGLWEKTDSVNTYYKGVKDNLLPAMIFLMLLRCDLRKIFKLGPKMLIGFFCKRFL